MNRTIQILSQTFLSKVGSIAVDGFGEGLKIYFGWKFWGGVDRRSILMSSGGVVDGVLLDGGWDGLLDSVAGGGTLVDGSLLSGAHVVIGRTLLNR